MKISEAELREFARKCAPDMREIAHETLLDASVWADDMINKNFPGDFEDKELHKTMLIRTFLMATVAYFISQAVKDGSQEEFLDSMVSDIKMSSALTGLFK